MAKVIICALTLGRPELTRQTWQNNLNNAGCDFDLLWFDNGSNKDDNIEIFNIALQYRITWFEWSKHNTGIANALNTMIKTAFVRGADYIVTMANDIIEPDGWVKMRVEAAQAIDNTGVVSIPVKGAKRYRTQRIDNTLIEQGQVIGNWLITREAIEQVGLFYTGFGVYGPLDLEYCDRLEAARLKRYYLSNQHAEHLGIDNPKEYQAKKEASLNKSWPKYRRRREDIKAGKVSFYFFE
jgi:GT2 family glycosyltransferase